MARLLNRVKPYGGTALYDAVPAGLRALARGQHRRRALVVITDGNDAVPTPRRMDPAASLLARREGIALEAVRVSEALVYAIGVDPSDAGINVNALESLTAPTGGITTLVKTDDAIVTAAEQIGDELRQQYVLGVMPLHPGDGKFHKLQITVSGCADCHVRARSGYIADK